MAINQYVYDDGSVIGWDTNSSIVQSKEIGSNAWVDDAQPAPADWNVFSTDAQEQSRLAAGYPANGQAWSDNAALLGITRLIDTATRSYATVKGATAATYAGQNGQTYQNGRNVQTGPPGGDLGMLLILGALFVAMG